MSMRRSLVLAAETFPPLIEIAKAADAAGFHRVWTTENNAYDAVIRAVVLGLNTERIGVGTGIAYHFTRAPLAAAVMAAEAQSVTGGRFTLGLGAGTRGMRSRWYGLDDDRPAARFAEYVALVKTVWQSSTGLEFQGEFFSADIPTFHLSQDAAHLAALRVYGSGLNARMLEVAASSCDGVALHPLARSEHYLDEVVSPALGRAADRSGRSCQLAAWQITSVDDDEDVARQRARQTLAFYFSTPSYRTIAEGTNWQEAVRAIRETYKLGGAEAEWSRLAQHVTDEMVDDMTLAGTPEQVRTRLPAIEADLAQRGVDELVFQTVGKGLTPAEVLSNCRGIIEVCAP